MKKIIQYSIIVSVVVLLFSCSDFFVPSNENLITADYVQTDPSSVEGLMLNAYSQLVNAYVFSDLATDDAVSNQPTNAFRRMASGELSANFNPITRWDKYQGIFYVNRFLGVADSVKWMDIPELGQLFNRRLKGEALALRALLHFYILEANAGKDAAGNLMGIPYYTKFIQADGNLNVPRLTFTATIDSIMADFNKAYEYLPYVYLAAGDSANIPAKDLGFTKKYYLTANSTNYDQRFNGKIVRALQARVKLFAASKAYLDDLNSYKEAANFATGVLTAISYVLPSAGVEFYNSDAGATNTEFLWRTATTATSASSTQEANNFPPSLNGKGYINPTQNLVDAFYMKDGYPIGKSPTYTYNAQDPYINRDARLAKFVIFNGSFYGGKYIYTNTTDIVNGINAVPQQSTRTGYYLKKLLRPDVVIPISGTATGQKHYNAIYRYTELFLILAEAENEIGGPDYKEGTSTKSARDILRALRKRALSITTDPYLDGINNIDDMRTLIQNERRLELCFEGFRIWDLRRWGLPLTETATGYSCTPTIVNEITTNVYTKFDVEPRMYDGEKYRYMPWMYNELQKYPNLVQNAGW
jgi:hypothetical protein